MILQRMGKLSPSARIGLMGFVLPGRCFLNRIKYAYVGGMRPAGSGGIIIQAVPLSRRTEGFSSCPVRSIFATGNPYDCSVDHL
jgi:hypothetical protein